MDSVPITGQRANLRIGAPSEARRSASAPSAARYAKPKGAERARPSGAEAAQQPSHSNEGARAEDRRSSAVTKEPEGRARSRRSPAAREPPGLPRTPQCEWGDSNPAETTRNHQRSRGLAAVSTGYLDPSSGLVRPDRGGSGVRWQNFATAHSWLSVNLHGVVVHEPAIVVPLACASHCEPNVRAVPSIVPVPSTNPQSVWKAHPSW